MDKNIVDAINRSPHKAFISVAGGGQNFIGEFCDFSGASATILGFYVPYNQDLFNEFISGKPDNYASEEAARKLAVASYKKALKIVGNPEHTIGIGAASSVAADNERVGRTHRLCVAIQTEERTKVISFHLNQGRTRTEENRIISETILYLLAIACGVEPFPIQVNLQNGEYASYPEKKADYEVVQLVHGKRKYVASDNIQEEPKIVLFCGSFNPFHEGHAKICEIAQRVTGQRPYVELSVANTDKPFMDYIEIDKRVQDIRAHNQRVLLTNAPRYFDKVQAICEHNPKFFSNEFGITFVVGADTWVRIWDEKYGLTPATLIPQFTNHDVKFLVFKRGDLKMEDYRKVVTNNFYWSDIENLVIPCKEADEFGLNISSTELRKLKGAD